jgi:hypothetical protein
MTWFMWFLRASTMENSNFEYLNGSHMDTSLIYHFLIIVPNRYSTTPMEYFLKSFKMGLINNSTFLKLCKKRKS